MASPAGIDLAALTEPISENAPSGPDLEADDDDETYINFVSATEVVLPTEYMIADHTGDRLPFQNHPDFKDLDLGTRIGAARTFCGLTHDLRLLALLAKLCILNRSPSAFETVVQAIAVLLETEWATVHPSVGAGEGEWRTAAVERLDEPLIVAALNNAPLFTSRRFGPLTMQAYTSAARKASGGGEDTSSIDRVLADECGASPELVRAIRSTVDRLAQALARIRAAFAAQALDGIPRLAAIGGAVGRLAALLDRIDPAGSAPVDPGAAGEESAPDAVASPNGAASVVAKPTIATARQAAAALETATRYLIETEPSSPALLLLRQAQALLGKSFLEAMKALFPETVKHAGFTVAAPTVFRLPLTLLADNGAARKGEDGSAADDEEAISFAPLSRAEAIALLDGAAAYYRAAEPSSPIPMLLDRARPLLGQDFMALVRSMLPEKMLTEK